jgi:hypothetical protein
VPTKGDFIIAFFKPSSSLNAEQVTLLILIFSEGIVHFSLHGCSGLVSGLGKQLSETTPVSLT